MVRMRDTPSVAVFGAARLKITRWSCVLASQPASAPLPTACARGGRTRARSSGESNKDSGEATGGLSAGCPSHRARQSLRKWLPGVQESADASAPVIGYSFGPGYRGLVCTLILSKSGVKLGLVRGSELADPHGLLAGSGKVHRHIQLGAASDLRKAGVSQLVKAAHKAWKERQ